MPWWVRNLCLGGWPAERLLAEFGRARSVARRRYERFVADGIGGQSLWNELRRQIYLGDDLFIARMQAKLDREVNDVNIPRVQRRRPAASLELIATQYQERDHAVVAAYETGEYGYQRIAEHFGVHFTTVGRIVRAAKARRREPDGRSP